MIAKSPVQRRTQQPIKLRRDVSCGASGQRTMPAMPRQEGRVAEPAMNCLCACTASATIVSRMD
jgi:hypothetical protein